MTAPPPAAAAPSTPGPVPPPVPGAPDGRPVLPVALAVGAGVAVPVADGDPVPVPLGDGVAEHEGEAVAVAEGVTEDVTEGVTDGVTDGVTEDVGVTVTVTVTCTVTAGAAVLDGAAQPDVAATAAPANGPVNVANASEASRANAPAATPASPTRCSFSQLICRDRRKTVTVVSRVIGRLPVSTKVGTRRRCLDQNVTLNERSANAAGARRLCAVLAETSASSPR
jgi:hypothetical protein